MLKSKVKKWHLLLGLFFLLKCNLKVARGGDAPQCTSTECKLGEIYPVPGEDDTQVKPQKDCYQSGDVVYYKCYGNLIGRTQNTCQRGSWEYLDGPVCIADCHLPTLDNGRTIPSVSPIKDGKQIEFVCDRRYTLVGVSVSICEDGEFDPPEIPLCYAQCNPPMIPNSNSTSPNPLIDHGGVIVVRCNDGYYNGESETTTSVCNDGILDPVVPFCYAHCDRPNIPDSDSTSPTPALKHGDNITVTCDSGYSSDLGKSMTAVCIDGTLNPTVPYCFAQCKRPLILNSDATSSTPAIIHGDSVTVTCNIGYSNGQIDSLSTTSICNHGTLIPAVPLCYAQCQRPMIPNSDATMPDPVVDHRGVIVVTCDDGYSNGHSQGTTSVCNDGIFNPSVPSCYAQCSRPVIPNSDATSFTPVLDHGNTLTVTCVKGYSTRQTQSTTSECINGTLNPTVPFCYAQCNRPIILNSNATSSTPVLDDGDSITVTCNTGHSTGQTESTSSRCFDGTLSPEIPPCYAKCSRPMIPNSDSSSTTPLLDHGDAVTVTCDIGYSDGKSRATTSTCDDGSFDPPFSLCYPQCNRPVIPDSDATSAYPVLNHGEELTVTCNSGYSNGQSIRITTMCNEGTLIPAVPPCYEQCNRPVIQNSDASSVYPSLNHGDVLTVTCNAGYSNGHSMSTTTVCKDGGLAPPVLLCYAQCQRPMIPNSDATIPDPVVDHRGVIVVTCDDGYSNGLSQGTTSVCYDGIFNPFVPLCYAQCSRPVIPNSDATSFTPVLDHGNTLTVTCVKGYSTGQTQSTTSECINGTLNPTVSLCYAQCHRPIILNSNATSLTPVLDDGDSITVTCNTGYSNGATESTSSRCFDGTLTPDIPPCYAKCSRPMIPNSDSSSSTPLLDHGDALTVTCDVGYSDGKSRATTSTCDDGSFDPPFSLCYPQCNRPVIPDSDATSAYPVLDHGEELTVTCNNGFSNGQSIRITTMCNEGTLIPAVPPCYEQCDRPVIQNSDASSVYPSLEHGDAVTVTCDAGYSNGHSMSTTTVCNDGVLAPPVLLCYAQCARPVIPNSDATLYNPALHHGESVTVTCNNGYSSGKSQSTTSLCDHGTLNPAVPSCHAQCSRPVIPNSDATSSHPVLNHDDIIIVKCNSGYSNGRTQSSTSVCSYGTLDPSVPSCHAQCNRPVIPNSDSTSPQPVLHHGGSLSVTCDTGYSNGQSGSMTAVCTDGSLNLALPFCYAQCNRVIIQNSDATSSEPGLHTGDVITVTCNIGFSNGYSDSTTSVCSHGTFNPPLLQCYAQCSRPIIPHSDVTSSSQPLHHGELLTVTCNTGYSNSQSQSSTSRCADGELKPDVPLCNAQCNRPAIPNSDSTSSFPVLHNGDTITVTCDNGYSNGKSKETTSLCDLGILDPAIPPCYAQCSKPVIPNSDATSSHPVLNHGDVIIVKCNNGYSNGQSPSATSVCNYGSVYPTLPFCFAQCNRPVIANSDATSPYPVLNHGEALTITCDTGYSNGQSRRMATLCTDGIINIALQFCFAQCSLQVIPNSDSTSSNSVHHGEVLIVTCDEGYSSGQGNITSSACTNGIFIPPLPTCYADCKSLKHPDNGEILSGSNPHSHREVAVFNCNGNYTLFGDKEIYCYDGLWDRDPPVCMGYCSRPVIPNSDAISPTPLVPHGIAITVTCNDGYTNSDTARTTLVCLDGTLSPDEPTCITQCNRVIIKNSDSTSSEPSLHSGDAITVTCNIGFSNGYSNSTTSVCSHGTFTPPLTHCYAQCSRPIIPNSDATSSSPALHHGEQFILTCNTGYSNWQSQSSTSMCTDGELKPDVPLCYAQCSRPVIPNSDATSSNPVLNHGDVIIVKCNDGYSNGQSPSATSVCNYGSVYPTLPFCFAQCNRPVIPNSDATSPYPLLDHGEALTMTCDTGYSNGQSRRMATLCTDGIINLALQFCFAQCSRRVIPKSDSSSSSPPIHHGEVLIVTCDEGYSSGQGQSTSSGCSHGIFNPPLPTCYADCQSFKTPNHGGVVIGSNPYSHREAVVFKCNENYTLFGNQEIYCYDGLWDRDPPVCMAPCSRPVIPNSDAISPNPLVPHGIVITVTCNKGYTNGDTARAVLVCLDGTISPDEPKCIGQTMDRQDVAGLVLGVLGTVLAIAAIILEIYWKDKGTDKDERLLYLDLSTNA